MTRISPKPASTMRWSRSWPNDTIEDERLSTCFCRVCSAVWPCSWILTLMPCWSSVRWRSASDRLAERTRAGTSRWSRLTWSVTGLTSSATPPASATKNPTYTAATASPRGIRVPRWTTLTRGLSMSAMTAAMTKISSTTPAARASAHTARSATGSVPSWIQRGTTTFGGASGIEAAWVGASSSAAACAGGASGSSGAGAAGSSLTAGIPSPHGTGYLEEGKRRPMDLA